MVDWILVNATAQDLGPLQDMRVLGASIGAKYEANPDFSGSRILAYRPPGAILLASPLLLVESPLAHILLGIVGLISFLWLVLFLVPRFCEKPVQVLLWPLLLSTISIAYIESVFWGTVSSLVAALATWTLLRPASHLGGISLALATALKLYPGLMFVPMAVRRRARSGLLVGVTAVAVLTIAGILAFDLSISESVRLLQEGSEVWLDFPGNLSIAAFLGRSLSVPAWAFPVITCLGIAGVAVYSLRRPFLQSMAVAATASVLISPISWLHYDVLLIPMAIWLWAKFARYPAGGVVAVLWLIAQAIAAKIAEIATGDIGRILIFNGRIAILAAIAFAPSGLWSQQSRLQESVER